MPVSQCPACGQILDRAAGAAEPPRKDDIGVCGNCGAINQYNENQTVRSADPGWSAGLTLADIAKIYMASALIKRHGQKERGFAA